MTFDDGFYIDFLRKKYPKNPELHNISKGLVQYMKEVYHSEPEYHTVEWGKRFVRGVHNRGKPAKKQMKYERTTISQILADKDVEVEGLIVDRHETKQYVGCPICKKKECFVHDNKKVNIYFHQFILEDDTSEVIVAFGGLEENFTKVDSGDRVVVRGRAKLYKETISIHVYDFEVLNRPKGIKEEEKEKIIEELNQVGVMRENIFLENIRLSGLELKDFEGIIKIEQTELGRGVKLCQ